VFKKFHIVHKGEIAMQINIRNLFSESIITAAVGLAVLILSALFPALRSQFEVIAPSVVVIVLAIVAALFGDSLSKTAAQTRIEIARIEVASAQAARNTSRD
jgi:hypothetical protein